ncbi:Uridine kinase-like protein [Kribbella flavida DSM 17836]|uniref:Uridine kinase-like protein n=1 Tax=Kribbella flavida (strain DSM 17836 / JCM 10339 / NBRC 14399) TaxID=479435 RepID=D2PKE5_KRIFD|nr:ATP-binding protein [Kribbella flavida]ADB30457.1 Uridine kinase-like protein [Kribbella flavida DSM 17836]
MSARVVLLAGPSGTGKSHLAELVGLPVVRLDDFYRDGDDDAMPRSPLGIVDWDDPGSWDARRAVDALETLCTTGSADMPIYDIAVDSTVGHRAVTTGGSPLVIAEGIFADQIAGELRTRGLLAAAICVRHHRVVTFVRRFQRDLREHRKPPWTLLRRGLLLLKDDPRVVRRCLDAGCEPLHPRAARRRIADLLAAATTR